MAKIIDILLYLTLTVLLPVMAQTRKNYSMYVWTEGFDPSVSGCDVNKFLKWNLSGPCFTHSWNTATKRAWLWNTCNRPGREISTIYISGALKSLIYAYDNKDCMKPDVTLVKQMLTEGHTKVPGLKIYGLLSSSNLAVTERTYVKYIVNYNNKCASSDAERFDGVATNNEAYTKITCAAMDKRRTYLDNLKEITAEAGSLLTHFSVAWHWGSCNKTQQMITWNGQSKDAVHHMIDIFDSVDVQVAWIQENEIVNRLGQAGFNYSVSLQKPIFVNVYTNKDKECRSTFFPGDNCTFGGKTESNMFTVLDSLPDMAEPCIHHFRGVYSSGGHPDWPAYKIPDSCR